MVDEMVMKGLKENHGILNQVWNHNYKRQIVDRPTSRTTSPLNDLEKGFQYIILKILCMDLRRKIHGPWIDPQPVLFAVD